MTGETPKTEKPIKVEIERYDPETGKSWRQRYEVPLQPGWSVLNVLTWIYENIDPTLGYYYSCRIGKCNGCNCIVNGKKKLTCNTLADGDMILEPLADFEMFKDLIPNRFARKGKVAAADDEGL
jgi:fumarate reductase iron-sulfur subunit